MAQTTQQPDYNQLRRELTELTAQLEQGDMGIDETVKSYERGLQLIAQLEAHLQAAENRVRELREQYDQAAEEEE